MTLLATPDQQKRAAALRAVGEVESDMLVGLGSGSTASHAIAALAARVKDGLRIRAIATSNASARLARHLGIPLAEFRRGRPIDLTIDGADQVALPGLMLIKGLGGALLREKIVASASRRMIVVVDESKLVPQLGDRTPLPVEITAFGCATVLDRLAEAGYAPELRMAGKRPMRTDSGHRIADCVCAAIDDPAALQAQLAGIVGVIESGLFIGLASQIVVGRAGGVELVAG